MAINETIGSFMFALFFLGMITGAILFYYVEHSLIPNLDKVSNDLKTEHQKFLREENNN